MTDEIPCTEGCKIEDELAQVCQKHYSQFMEYPMECSLVTDKEGGLRIFKKLGVIPA